MATARRAVGERQPSEAETAARTDGGLEVLDAFSALCPHLLCWPHIVETWKKEVQQG